MTIIDRARDALKGATPGPWRISGGQSVAGIRSDDWDGDDSAKANRALAALAPETAAAVVRVAELADELGASWESAPVIDGYKSSGAGMALHAALRIRAALEGGDVLNDTTN